MKAMDIPLQHDQRRAILGKNHPGAAWILPAASLADRNHYHKYPFRQESNFLFLTGLTEPDACLVLVPKERGSNQLRSILFVLPRNMEREIWEGERYGFERAKDVFRVDEAYSIEEFWTRLPGLLGDADRIFYRLNRGADRDRQVLAALDQVRLTRGRSGLGVHTILDPQPVIGELRVRKDQLELTAQRQATHWSALAHRELMSRIRPDMNEREVLAIFEFLCRRAGCNAQAYESIVAGGVAASCLHYNENNAPMRDGNLLLIDAGGEVDGYAADITRTYPIGLEYTALQAKMYDTVLDLQKQLVASCGPGTSFFEMQKRAHRYFAEALSGFGWHGLSADAFQEAKKVTDYYPHNIGHFLGLDTHDAGIYMRDGQPRGFEPGMVLTIEPGLYFQKNDLNVPEEIRGLGIRIEDDILITENGCEVLTREAPKERTEIEALRRKAMSSITAVYADFGPIPT